MQKIAFIGLGHMGNPMAKRLMDAGYPVKVFDVNPPAMQPFKKNAVETLKDAISDADVIFTMLQKGQQVKKVCAEIFLHAKKNILYIDCSSIDMTTTRELHSEAAKNNIRMLDAPVSGGVTGATAGTLTIMVGGEVNDFAEAHSILEKLGKKIILVGASGHGQAAKICNNLILGISMIAVSEGFTLAEALGIDLKKFFEVSSQASGQCWSMTNYCPVPNIIESAPSNHEYKPGFTANMMLKDLLLGMHAADSVNAVIPLGAVATELYSLFIKQGHGEMDFSGIIQMLSSKK
jgi:3-hydroxyisobutyrate dehydrogenase